MSEENKSNIYTAMVDIMNELSAIGKNSKSQQGYGYRGIDAVYNELHPIMSKHGVFCTPKVLDVFRDERTTGKGGVLFYSRLKMKYTFHHISGTSLSCSTLGEGMDSGDKASNKAMSIAQKYALFQCFLIPTEDLADPDKENYSDIQPKQEIKHLLKAHCEKVNDEAKKEEIYTFDYGTKKVKLNAIEWLSKLEICVKDKLKHNLVELNLSVMNEIGKIEAHQPRLNDIMAIEPILFIKM